MNETKALLDYEIKHPIYSKLASELNRLTQDSPFKGHVFLRGDYFLDSLLGLPTDDSEIEVVTDVKNGGTMLPFALGHQLGCVNVHDIGKMNPCFSLDTGDSYFEFKGIEGLEGRQFKFSQTRSSYKYGETRGALTIFGDINIDAKMRGFTVDSLYYNVFTHKLFDVTGKAFSDIESRTIRSEFPHALCYDNPLNIFRAAYLAAKYGLGIDKYTWLAMIANSNRLLPIKSEIYRDWLNKLVMLPRPSIAFEKLLHCNGLKNSIEYFSEMNNVHLYKDETLFEHTMKVLDTTNPTLIGRLGALFHDIGKVETSDKEYMYHQMVGAYTTTTVMQLMGYDKKTAEAVSAVVEYHDDLRKFVGSTVPGTKYAEKFVEKCGNELEYVLDVIDANNKCQRYGKKAKQVENMRKEIAKLPAIHKRKEKQNLLGKLPINGNDIRQEFNVKGQIIGKILNAAVDEYAKHPDMTKEQCMSVCREYVDKIYGYK